MNLVKNVGKSSPVPKNVAVDLKEDAVCLSSRKGNVSSSEDGNTDDVLYVPPEKISDVREKESLPVIKRAEKRAQPSVSLVDKDNNVANLQLISDCTMCRLCGHEVSHVGSIHLNLSLSCPFCDFVFYGEEKAAVHLRIHGLNPDALEGEEKVAVMKEWNIYFKEMEEMFEKCFPPRHILACSVDNEVSTCLVCNMKVTSKAERRAHVSDCHLKHTLVCPKAECDFETFKEVSMAKHLKGEHKIERFKLDAEERRRYIQMLAVFVKKLKPVLQMCFPHSASFASADLKSNKAVSAQLTSIPAGSVLSNVSVPHGSQKMSPNKFSIAKKTIQTTSLTRSSSSSSSDRRRRPSLQASNPRVIESA
uniref:C2H2-type domain-containing protein n=1 Tax=Ditylenchus dipsaci TaxID=166011 RepID=A0A915DX71_9BILA